MEVSANAQREFVSMPNLYIKNESLDDPEIPESELTTNNDTTMAAIDPMNLLEIVEDCNNEALVFEQNESYGDLSAFNNDMWRELMLQYPWLLHEAKDGKFGFCLYCNISLSVTRSGHVKKHLDSLHHKENAENYIAFKTDEEKAGGNDQIVDIKQEFGTSSNISALKFKRISQADPLNSFNWRRWLQSHKWLVRDRHEGTIGFCKICCTRVTVEYSYQRTRHEESIRHINALKKNKFEQQAKSNGESGDDEEITRQTVGTTSNNDASNISLKIPQSEWFESLSNQQNSCRCTLCNLKMTKKSYIKHLKSKVHAQNLRYQRIRGNKRFESSSIDVKTEPKFNRWKIFSKSHPWLIADPIDPTYGYCKYCEKRLIYAYSSSKRLVHENSAQHNAAIEEYNDKKSNAEDKTDEERNQEEGEEKENHSEDQEQQNESSGEYNDEDQKSDDDQESDEAKSETSEVAAKKTRVKRFSDAWFKVFPWCKKNPKDPSYIYCSYCDILLSNTIARIKHIKTARHIAGEKAHLPKEKHIQALKRTLSKRASSRHNNTWLQNGHKKPVFFCKYCRIRFYTSFSKNKHAQSPRHREAIAKYKAKKSPLSSVELPPNYVDERNPKELSVLPSTSMNTKVLQWNGKFPWISYKRSELRPNYCYCNYCEQTIFVPTLKYASKHSKSLKHLRKRRDIQRLKVQIANLASSVTTTTEQTDSVVPAARVSDQGIESFEDMQKSYPWLIPDKKKQKYYGFCKYCEVRLKIVGICKINHQRTLKHQASEKKFLESGCVTPSTDNRNDQHSNIQDEIVVLPDDDDDDEVISVKSETDTNYAMEYLLQQIKSGSSKAATENNLGAAAKRPRLSTHNRELLRTISNCRDHNNLKRKKTSLPESILNSPVEFAAYLSAFIQRDARPTAERNTFDLFFNSVSETVKNLPNDLAAEARIKVMQIIYDFELRAMQRRQATDQSSNSTNNNSTTRPTITTTTAEKSVPSDVVNGTEDTLEQNHVLMPKTVANSVNRVTLNSTMMQSDPEATVYQLNNHSPLTSAADMAENPARTIHITTPKTISNRTESGIRCIPINTLTSQPMPSDRYSHLLTNQSVQNNQKSASSSNPMLQSQLARPLTKFIHINPQTIIRPATLTQAISNETNSMNFPRTQSNQFYA